MLPNHLFFDMNGCIHGLTFSITTFAPHDSHRAQAQSSKAFSAATMELGPQTTTWTPLITLVMASTNGDAIGGDNCVWRDDNAAFSGSGEVALRDHLRSASCTKSESGLIQQNFHPQKPALSQAGYLHLSTCMRDHNFACSQSSEAALSLHFHVHCVCCSK